MANVTPLEYICIHCGDLFAEHSAERLDCLKLIPEGRRHAFTNYTGRYFEGQRDVTTPFAVGPVDPSIKFKYPDWEERLKTFADQTSD
jgi:hypothetical protein